MYILGILSFFMVPFLLGTLITELIRVKKAGFIEKYATGFVSCCLIMLGCILVSLKLDWSLKRLEMIFGILVGIGIAASLAVVFGRVLKKSIERPQFVKVSRDVLWFVIPAVLLGVYSYFGVLPSYLNDDTWEMVATTVSTGTFYKYSALTGFEMEAGLPIFNKIPAMPMIFAVVADVFGVDMWLMGRYFVPIIVYVVNLSLIYRISGQLFEKSQVRLRATFMCAYLIFIMAGTYLPSKGLPVTIGYAILREGYGGYAVAYGVALPLILLFILEGQYLPALVPAASLLCLLRLDRVYFNLVKYPVVFQESVNSAGKLSAVYFAALVAFFFFANKCLGGKKKVALLFPAVCVSYMTVILGTSINSAKKRTIFYLGVSCIIFSACVFRPFEDAVLSSDIKGTDNDLMNCLSTLDEGAVVWGTEEVMADIRRLNGNVCVLYSRAIYTPEASGLDYEKEIDEYKNISNLIKWNGWYYSDDNLIGIDENRCLEIARQCGENYMIIPKDMLGEYFEDWLISVGFVLQEENARYYVFKDMGV